MDSSDTRPSKSARKREHLALQALGEKLIGLKRAQLDSLELEQRLLDAVLAARTMRARGALRRQKQLIGKLMRNIDPEPIRAAVDAFGRHDRQATALFHEAEAWRDRVVADGMPAVERFESETGLPNDSLRENARALGAATNAGARQHAKRRIFRDIHAHLRAQMQAARK